MIILTYFWYDASQATTFLQNLICVCVASLSNLFPVNLLIDFGWAPGLSLIVIAFSWWTFLLCWLIIACLDRSLAIAAFLVKRWQVRRRLKSTCSVEVRPILN